MSFYVAIQALLDRDGEIARDELDDAAVWATSELGGEWLPLVRDRAPRDALERMRTAYLDARAVRASSLGASPTAAAIERAREAVELRLENCTLGARNHALLAQTRFAQLRILALARCRLTETRLRALCDAENLATVERLDLSGNALRDGIEVLARARAFPALRSLNLGYTRATCKSIDVLSRSPALAGLRSLELATDKLGAPLGEILARPSAFPSLRRLNIYKATLANRGLAALAARPSLRVLHVMENGVGNSGIEALAASPASGSLVELRCRYDPIGGPALAAIAGSPHLRALRRLQLSQCRLDRDGIKALARSEHVALEYLNVGTNPSIGPDGITFLGGSAACRGLRELVIDGVNLGDDGAAYLATVDGWPHLERLSLHHDELTDRGLDALLRWPQLRRLRSLDLGTNDITPAGLERLVHTPGLRLEHLGLWQTPCAASARAIVDASPLRGIQIDSSLFWRDYPAWVD